MSKSLRIMASALVITVVIVGCVMASRPSEGAGPVSGASGMKQSAFALNANFENGVAKASIALGTSDLVNVSIETTQPPKGYIYSRAFMWGGDETTPPKKIVRAITILRNGQIAFVPLSAYADLGNPSKITLLKLSPHEFRLIIGGGDAAGSYNAMLDFKNNEISRRKVVSGAFPKEVWEETIFSFNHLDN